MLPTALLELLLLPLPLLLLVCAVGFRGSLFGEWVGVGLIFMKSGAALTAPGPPIPCVCVCVCVCPLGVGAEGEISGVGLIHTAVTLFCTFFSFGNGTVFVPPNSANAIFSLSVGSLGASGSGVVTALALASPILSSLKAAALGIDGGDVRIILLGTGGRGSGFLPHTWATPRVLRSRLSAPPFGPPWGIPPTVPTLALPPAPPGPSPAPNPVPTPGLELGPDPVTCPCP